MFCVLEGPQDWLGLQECEEAWECVRSHVPHGNDVSDHHRSINEQGQVLRSTSDLAGSGSCLIHSHRYGQFLRAYTSFVMCRCMKLSLVHDMAECIVGDITPSDNVSKAEKHRREEASATTTTHRPPGTITFSCVFFLFLLFISGSNETTHRSSARWTQTGDLCAVGGI